MLALLGRAVLAQPQPLPLHVTIAGNELPLHHFNQGSFGNFELTAPVEVVIRADFNVRWVDLRPRSAGVTATIDADHRTIRFRITTARPLTVEFNRDLARVLHLFPATPEDDAPKPGDAKVRYFGPGIHDAGLMDLAEGETLYLAAGAWVKGNVRSIGTRSVSIRGRGVLDGTDIPNRPATTSADRTVKPIPEDEPGARNMIYLQNVEGAAIKGITVFNSHYWTVFVRSCRNVHVDGVNVLSGSNHYGNDGFDLVSSSDVLVENVFVRTNDDCVVVKNLDDIETKNIEVRRSTFWNMPVGGNAIEVGFELRSRGASHLVFRDCDILHVERGSAISIHQGDSGTVEDVRFEDIRVEDVRRKLIDFCVLYAQYGIDKPASQAERERRMDPGGVWDGEQRLTPDEYRQRAAERGRIRNVQVRNLQVIEGALPYSIIAGYDDDHLVENVTIDGLSYLGQPLRSFEAAQLVVHDAKNVTIK